MADQIVNSPAGGNGPEPEQYDPSKDPKRKAKLSSLFQLKCAPTIKKEELAQGQKGISIANYERLQGMGWLSNSNDVPARRRQIHKHKIHHALDVWQHLGCLPPWTPCFSLRS